MFVFLNKFPRKFFYNWLCIFAEKVEVGWVGSCRFLKSWGLVEGVGRFENGQKSWAQCSFLDGPKTAQGTLSEKNINYKALELCRNFLQIILNSSYAGTFSETFVQILWAILSRKIQYCRHTPYFIAYNTRTKLFKNSLYKNCADLSEDHACKVSRLYYELTWSIGCLFMSHMLRVIVSKYSLIDLGW